MAKGLFPYGAWAASVRKALASESEQTLIGESKAEGSRRLREAIARNLQGFRGMRVDPDCVVVGAGSQTLDNLIIQLLGRTAHYGIETPGYPRLACMYRANEVACTPIRLDAEGVSLDHLRASGVTVLHVSPSHQFPTGLVTPISRRYELLAWASQAPERFLIEDDYDCEFRLTGRPIPSLQSIDTQGRVIYTNTFAKTLGPAFRLGYMVLPPALMRAFRERLGFYSCTVSAIDQLALARFIEDGHYERHVNRMRTHYRNVRDALVSALGASSLAGRLTIASADAGIHFVLGVESELPDVELARRAAHEGVRIVPLSSYRLDADAGEQGEREWKAGKAEPSGEAEGCKSRENTACFLVSYGGLEEAAIERTVRALEKAFGED